MRFFLKIIRLVPKCKSITILLCIHGWIRAIFTHKTESLWPLHFKHSHWWKRCSCPFSLHATLEGPRSMWMQDRCKVYMDSYMVYNGSCLMVTLTIFKNHLLEVGLTQNWKTLRLRPHTTVGLFYFSMYEDPYEYILIEGAIGWVPMTKIPTSTCSRAKGTRKFDWMNLHKVL